MKSILSVLGILIAGLTLSAHTISFGTSADANGVLTGEGNTLSVKQSDGVAMLITHTTAFGETRYVVRTFEQFDGLPEVKKDTFYVDVHKNWTWVTTGITTSAINRGDYKYRVALFDMNGKELCSSILNLTIKTEGAIFIDQDKAAAYGDIWGAMTFSVKKAEISVIGRASKKGGRGFSQSTVSLAEGKEIQITVHAIGSTVLSGKLKYNYTLVSNTSGKPDVTAEVAVKDGSKSATHNAKLGEGQWKLSVLDESGAELASSEFTVTK